ncbi:MAG: ABC transporter permease, partial [Anaerolineae bacterium]|nr:ABC transporter permease [Anaerolineae bacterium]
LDKPLVMRYLVWLIGEDWLGANYMYLGLKLPENMRFYAEPGIAYAQGGYTLWVQGAETGMDADGFRVITADKIWIRPDGEAPEDALVGLIVEVNDRYIELDVEKSSNEARIVATASTAWEAAIVPTWPEGNWVNISWLTGPYGLLGKYAHFHGDGHGILRMDFGTSWSVARGQPISGVIGSRLKHTITLSATSIFLSLVVAIPVGIYSAVKQYSRLDYVVTTFTFFGTAMPVFWLGLMLVLIFSIQFQRWGLPYFPAGGVASVRTPPKGSLLRALNITPGDFVDQVVHLILPTITLSMLQMAGWSRFMRASMLDVLRQDYVRTARAKGLAERMVIVKHAMRNALIPIVTIIVFTIPNIFGGATITETIFSWQGIGRLYYDALGADDWPLVMTILYISAVLTVIATLVGDILYTVVDPRIRYD